MKNKINVAAVVGPTASGKTQLAVGLAEKLGGEVVSADSMQIYKHMKIATAKPDKSEMRGVRHHMIDFLEPGESYSVAEYVNDASRCIADISGRNLLPIVAGGTGLYVDSLLNHIEFTQQSGDKKLRAELAEIYNEQGIGKLLEILSGFDPESANRLAPQKNVRRIIRAIEIYKTSGITLTEQNIKSVQSESPYNTVKIGINFRDRQNLYDRINSRVDSMMKRGLLDEARTVLNFRLGATSSMAIGYKELAPYFRGELPLEQCVENLKKETRHYAKRQITWFKRDPNINWLFCEDYRSAGEMLAAAELAVKKGFNIDG